MNQLEHITEVVGEECNEVAQECAVLALTVVQQSSRLAQRCSKINRFGLNDIQDRHVESNLERLRKEYWDLQASLDMLAVAIGMPKFFDADCVQADERVAHIAAKKAKVERYMEMARKNGSLT